MKRCRKNVFLIYPLIFGIVGCLLLFFASLIPESLIHDNSIVSAQEFAGWPSYYTPMYINDRSGMYDLFTDQLIVTESYNMSAEDLQSILLNPYCYSNGDADPDSFLRLLEGKKENTIRYSRYWQGFRMYIRPMLVFTSYSGILKAVAALLTVLLCFLSIKACSKGAASSVICIVSALALLSPATVMHSLQFSCCYVLSFAFMLVILSGDRSFNIPAVFCIFGIVTQFFDFYTTPVLTYGLPVLLLISREEYRDKRWKTIGAAFLGWAYGYLFMWIVKLLFVTIFTDEKGFSIAFRSFAGRVGIIKAPELLEDYSILEALKLVWWISCPGENEKLFFIILVGLVAVSGILIFLKKGRQQLFSNSAYLAVASLPVLWFACSAQPTRIHAFFQHRSIAVMFAGIFLFALQGIKSIEPEK